MDGAPLVRESEKVVRFLVFNLEADSVDKDDGEEAVE